jgi:hypothetical protein
MKENLKEKRVGFYAGCAGGFGFYVAWMILANEWQTITMADSIMKDIIGFVLGLAVGALLYLGVYTLVNKKREATISKRITRYAVLGIATGLLIAFFFGMLFYNPTGLGPTPIFPLN